MIEEVGIRLRTDGVVESTNGLALTGTAVEKLGRQAAGAAPQLARLGVSAGQTQQAMRQLPAQITDVVTSLASGMPVWMVAIQQGGQIKDSFGGAVPAFNALRAVISPTALAVGGLGAAVAVVTLAQQKGAAEEQSYRGAILMTGNAAATTVGQLAAMARQVDLVAGTQAQAANVLAQLVSTGNVSRAQLEQGTQAAILLQRELGVEVETTVKAMSALGREPLAASIKLNEQYGYLTINTYNQIRALEQQGRTQEAAALAQEAYASTAITRAKEMGTSVGSLERGWRGLRDMAGEAWDAMLGIGRQGTLEAELESINRQLAAPLRRGVDPSRQAATRQALETRAADLRVRLAELQDAAKMEAQMAWVVKDQAKEDERNKNSSPGRKPAKAQGLYDFMGPLSEEQLDPQGFKDRERMAADAIRQEQVEQEGIRRLTLQAQASMRKDEQADRERRIAEERETQRIFMDIWALQPAEMKPVWEQILEGWQDTNQQMVESWDSTMTATLQAGEDAWVQWAQTGKFNIRSVAQAWLAEQARGAFRGLAGTIFMAVTGGGGGLAGATGSPEFGFSRPGEGFHSGGIAGGTPTFRRMLPASTWDGARRMHGGGIAGDEVPAVLKKKEGVFTEEQMRALAPVGSAPAAANRTVVFSPQIHIDSRTDRAEVQALVQGAMRSAQAELIDKMDRGEI